MAIVLIMFVTASTWCLVFAWIIQGRKKFASLASAYCVRSRLHFEDYPGCRNTENCPKVSNSEIMKRLSKFSESYPISEWRRRIWVKKWDIVSLDGLTRNCFIDNWRNRGGSVVVGGVKSGRGFVLIFRDFEVPSY